MARQSLTNVVFARNISALQASLSNLECSRFRRIERLDVPNGNKAHLNVDVNFRNSANTSRALYVSISVYKLSKISLNIMTRARQVERTII